MNFYGLVGLANPRFTVKLTHIMGDITSFKRCCFCFWQAEAFLGKANTLFAFWLFPNIMHFWDGVSVWVGGSNVKKPSEDNNFPKNALYRWKAHKILYKIYIYTKTLQIDHKKLFRKKSKRTHLAMGGGGGNVKKPLKMTIFRKTLYIAGKPTKFSTKFAFTSKSVDRSQKVTPQKLKNGVFPKNRFLAIFIG